MDDAQQHHHHHQAAQAAAGGASGPGGAGSPDDVRQHHVFSTYGSYSNAPAHHAPSMSIHDALSGGSSHQHHPIVARRQSRGFGADDPADLFPDLPEGKKRKFILVEDADRQARLRVRVTLEGVDTREIPDSFRKGSSVYPRSYFAREMQSPPPSATGSRFFADDLDDEDDGDVDTEGRRSGAGRSGRGKVLVKVPVGDGEETELAIPRMRKAARGKEVRLNDLGYRMAWLQSRVFAGRTVFLQRACEFFF